MSSSGFMSDVLVSPAPLSLRSLNFQYQPLATPPYGSWKMQPDSLDPSRLEQDQFPQHQYHFEFDLNKENRPHSFIRDQSITRAALPPSLQPARRRREDLNPLTRNAEARRNQQRQGYLRQSRQRREDAAWNNRSDHIQQQDSLSEWRRFNQRLDREAPEMYELEEYPVLDEMEMHDDLPQSEQRGPLHHGHRALSTQDIFPGQSANSTTADIDDVEAFARSQQAELDGLIALHEQESQSSHPLSQQLSHVSNDILEASTPSRPPQTSISGHSRYWSDDEEFEQAMLDAFDDDEQMDMTG